MSDQNLTTTKIENLVNQFTNNITLNLKEVLNSTGYMDLNFVNSSEAIINEALIEVNQTQVKRDDEKIGLPTPSSFIQDIMNQEEW